MNPIQRLENFKSKYTNVDLIIYTFIKKRPSEVMHLSIGVIAKRTKTSKAAIIRFCQKIGYKGFSEFKYELSRCIISGKYDANDSENLDIVTAIPSLYSGFIRQLSDFIKTEDIENLAKEIKSAKRVKIIGNNRTGLSAMQMRYRMSKIDVDAEAITDMALVYILEETFKEGDLIILFTVFADSKIYDDFIKSISKSKAKLAVITMTNNQKYLKHADFPFLLPCISQAAISSFLDDQAIMFVFIEIILAKLAS
ncbi:MAG: MurR/RpiR family transcriptional regulator [Erysipelotrichaceae bacterium]